MGCWQSEARSERTEALRKKHAYRVPSHPHPRHRSGKVAEPGFCTEPFDRGVEAIAERLQGRGKRRPRVRTQKKKGGRPKWRRPMLRSTSEGVGGGSK